jgi:hypothetical protein
MYTKSTLSTTRKPRENAFQTPQLTRFYPLRRPKTLNFYAQRLRNELPLRIRNDLVVAPILACDKIVAVRLRVDSDNFPAWQTLRRDDGRQVLAKRRVVSRERRQAG